MQYPADRARRALVTWLDREREADVARATGVQLAEAERLAGRARAALGTGDVREQLEEAVSTRALDDASHGALLEHLAQAAEAEVFARREVRLELVADDRAVVEGRERTLLELTRDVRDGTRDMARLAVTALTAQAAAGRNARLEAFAEAAEVGHRIRARGPAAPDDAPDSLRAECAAFLEATDDAARDLVARAHHSERAADDALVSRVRALSLPSLDAAAPARGRARRVGSVFAALGLGAEVTGRVDTTRSRLLAPSPKVSAHRGRAVVYESALELGVTSERALLGGVASALVRTLASPTLLPEHAHLVAASVASAMGAFFEGVFAEASFLRRTLETGDRDTARIRVACAAALVVEARAACVPLLLARDGGSPDAEREQAARALLLDPALVPLELASPSRVRPRDAVTNARARLAALAWAPSLRDRYDVDYFRNPRLSDFVRGAAARGGMVSAEQISVELGAAPALAARWVIELADRAG